MRPVSPPVFLVEHSEAVLARWAEPLASLTDDERRRARAFRYGRDRRDYVAAHLLVREAAAQVAGDPPADVTVEQHCAVCGRTGHGKPSLVDIKGLQVSLSRSRGMVAAAVHHSAVGVDLERPRAGQPLDDGLMARALAPGEIDAVRAAADPALAFLRLWVRKEAFVKAGVVALDSLADIDLSELPLHLQDGRGRTRWGRWQLVDHLEDRVVASAVALSP